MPATTGRFPAAGHRNHPDDRNRSAKSRATAPGPPVAATARCRSAPFSRARNAAASSSAAQPSRRRVLDLIESLRPAAAQLGCVAELEAAALLAGENGAERQRAVAAGGLGAVARDLADRFLSAG